MNTAFKQRMAGAIFVLSLGVILIPVILEKPVAEPAEHYSEKPASPGLPETGNVAKIQYVFNEVERNFQEQSSMMVAQADNTIQEASVATEPSSTPEPKPIAAQQDAKPLNPGEWTIQLGAFSSRENADGLLSKLTEEGFQSFLQETPGRGLVRVFVAPGIDHGDAETLLSELNQEMGLKGIIVRFRE